MSLSVLSALARSGVDPWQEAAMLRDLQKGVALLRLASLTEKLPIALKRLDASKIAYNLMASLPTPAGAAAATRGESMQVGAIKDPQVSVLLFFVVSLLVAISLSARQTPLRAENATSVMHDAYSAQLPSPARPMASSNARELPIKQTSWRRSDPFSSPTLFPLGVAQWRRLRAIDQRRVLCKETAFSSRRGTLR